MATKQVWSKATSHFEKRMTYAKKADFGLTVRVKIEIDWLTEEDWRAQS